jgi:hypothetical protein
MYVLLNFLHLKKYYYCKNVNGGGKTAPYKWKFLTSNKFLSILYKLTSVLDEYGEQDSCLCKCRKFYKRHV